MPKTRQVPDELIEAAKNFREVAMKHEYRVIGCAFRKASNKYKPASIAVFDTTVITFRIMVELLVDVLNNELNEPIILDDEWIPWDLVGRSVANEWEDNDDAKKT